MKHFLCPLMHGSDIKQYGGRKIEPGLGRALQMDNTSGGLSGIKKLDRTLIMTANMVYVGNDGSTYKMD